MRNIPVIPAVILLAACSGGGDEAPPLTVLSVATKADAQRELSNAATVANAFRSDPGAAAASQASFAVPRLGQPKQLRLPMQAFARSSAGLKPQAVQTQNCTNGGSSSYDSGSKIRSFSYFSYQAPVSWYTYTDAQCTEIITNPDSTTTTYISNGFSEDGSTPDGYSYQIGGTGGASASITFIDKTQAGAVTSQIDFAYRGLSEDYQTASLLDTRIGASLDISLATGGHTITASQTYGGSSPFKFTESSAGALTLDGDLSYTSNLPGCAGGTENYQTVNAITFGSDGYPNGGTLKISAGGAYVSITFKADGGADLVFSNGTMSSMTPAEVHDSVDNPSCSPPT